MFFSKINTIDRRASKSPKTERKELVGDKRSATDLERDRAIDENASEFLVKWNEHLEIALVLNKGEQY